jgi:hypothetical protein
MQDSDASMMDKVAGVMIAFLSLCGVCWGFGLAGLGGIVGVAGVAGARQGGAPAVAVGGVLGLIGFALIAIYAINIASGIGVFQSRR